MHESRTAVPHIEDYPIKAKFIKYFRFSLCLRSEFYGIENLSLLFMGADNIFCKQSVNISYSDHYRNNKTEYSY